MAYYLSSMALFNLIYGIRVFDFTWGGGIPISPFNIASFYLSLLLLMYGLISTVFIRFRNHEITNKNTLGKSVTVKACENITGDIYFSRYSVLVLTGMSLPMMQNYIGLVLYLVVIVTLGLVFIRQEMHYMNPLTVLLRANVVRAKCIDNGSLKDYYFIFSTGHIEVNQVVSFVHTNSRTIHLRSVNLRNDNNDLQEGGNL